MQHYIHLLSEKKFKHFDNSCKNKTVKHMHAYLLLQYYNNCGSYSNAYKSVTDVEQNNW